MTSLAGPAEASARSSAQQDFSVVSTAVAKYAASVGATKFAPGRFPAKTGLVAGEDCALVR